MKRPPRRQRLVFSQVERVGSVIILKTRKWMTRNAGWEVQRILLYERSWGNPQRVCVVGFGWNWGAFLNFWIIVCLKLMLGTWSERDEIQIASWTVHEVFWYIKTERKSGNYNPKLTFVYFLLDCFDMSSRQNYWMNRVVRSCLELWSSSSKLPKPIPRIHVQMNRGHQFQIGLHFLSFLCAFCGAFTPLVHVWTLLLHVFEGT